MNFKFTVGNIAQKLRESTDTFTVIDPVTILEIINAQNANQPSQEEENQDEQVQDENGEIINNPQNDDNQNNENNKDEDSKARTNTGGFHHQTYF